MHPYTLYTHKYRLWEKKNEVTLIIFSTDHVKAVHSRAVIKHTQNSVYNSDCQSYAY